MRTPLQDLRFAFRTLARDPSFTIVAVLTLALGIGANTLIFSLVNAALLRPLPFLRPERLVYVWSAERARGIDQSTVSIPDLRDWRGENHAFEGMAGWFSGSYNLSGGDEPQQVGGWVVSSNFFQVLGAGAEMGRTFGPGESPGSGSQVVVVSHALWAGTFGSDPGILGREIRVDGVPHTVIGVMPAEFSSPFPKVQIWAPWPERLEATAERGDRFLRVIARLRAGVSLERAQADFDTITPGLPVATRQSVPIVSFVQVTPGYFRAMGIPLLRGRDFAGQDNNEQSPKVAIVNATLAHRYLSDGNPIGRAICMGEDCSKGPWLTVVGVVGDSALESLTDPRFPQVFSPHAQGVAGGPAGDMELAVRASSDPLSLAAMVRDQVKQLDKNQPVADVRTLDLVVSASLAQPRMNTLLLGAFAALALLLAAIGVYGVISYAVAQRTREIGIRMALGASRRNVLLFTIRQGLRPVGVGVLLGIASALALTRFLAGLLYGVSAADPVTLASVASLLVIVALAACYIPARRAAGVDPLTALRYE